jgi:hypothetical protein
MGKVARLRLLGHAAALAAFPNARWDGIIREAEIKAAE